MNEALCAAETSFSSLERATLAVCQLLPSACSDAQGAGFAPATKRRRDEASNDAAGGSDDAAGTGGMTLVSAHLWLAAVIQAVRDVAAGTAPAAMYDSRAWHQERVFIAAESLPAPDAELPSVMPATLAVVHAEGRSTKDAQALRATGSPPPDTRPEYAARLLLSGVCDERQAFVGLRNMFMQSGLATAMHYELIRIPPNGMCVWLVAALLAARREARTAGREEPGTLSTGQVVDALRQMYDGVLSEDAILPTAIAKLCDADRDGSWDQLSGAREHTGNIHDVCETLVVGWHVHIPLFVLARHENAHGKFSVAVQIYGDADAPSVFGGRGGALVTYQVSNTSGPLLSHVDVLMPAPCQSVNG